MVRGGGERGPAWHEQGKLENKPNSFLDFNSCAEYLIANRITHPNYLVGRGRSAGGLLVAQACLNMRPELYRACVLQVPFLDVLGNLLEEDLPLAQTDHLEFGNPIESAEFFKTISSYSPYENLAQQEYPATFLTMSLNDPRIPKWSALKFIEKLRDRALTPEKMPNFGDKNIIMRIEREESSGHFGSVDNNENLKNDTQIFAWLDFLMLNPQSRESISA